MDKNNKTIAGSEFVEASKDIWRLYSHPEGYGEEIERASGNEGIVRVSVLGRVFAQRFDSNDRDFFHKSSIALAFLRAEVRMFYGYSAMQLRKSKDTLDSSEWAGFLASWAVASDAMLVMKVRNDFYKP